MKARENQLKQNASELPDLLRPWLQSSRKGDKKIKKQSKTQFVLKDPIFAANVSTVELNIFAIM
jgi:hypothetical protein